MLVRWIHFEDLSYRGFSLMQETDRMLRVVGDKISTEELQNLKEKLRNLRDALTARDSDAIDRADDELRRARITLVRTIDAQTPPRERFKHNLAGLVEEAVRMRLQDLNDAFRRAPERRVLMVSSGSSRHDRYLEVDVVAWGESSNRTPEHPLLIMEVKSGYSANLDGAIAQLQERGRYMPSRSVALVITRVDLRHTPWRTPDGALTALGVQRLEFKELQRLPEPGFVYHMDIPFIEGELRRRTREQ